MEAYSDILSRINYDPFKNLCNKYPPSQKDIYALLSILEVDTEIKWGAIDVIIQSSINPSDPNIHDYMIQYFTSLHDLLFANNAFQWPVVLDMLISPACYGHVHGYTNNWTPWATSDLVHDVQVLAQSNFSDPHSIIKALVCLHKLLGLCKQLSITETARRGLRDKLLQDLQQGQLPRDLEKVLSLFIRSPPSADFFNVLRNISTSASSISLLEILYLLDVCNETSVLLANEDISDLMPSYTRQLAHALQQWRIGCPLNKQEHLVNLLLAIFHYQTGGGNLGTDVPSLSKEDIELYSLLIPCIPPSSPTERSAQVLYSEKLLCQLSVESKAWLLDFLKQGSNGPLVAKVLWETETIWFWRQQNNCHTSDDQAETLFLDRLYANITDESQKASLDEVRSTCFERWQVAVAAASTGRVSFFCFSDSINLQRISEDIRTIGKNYGYVFVQDFCRSQNATPSSQEDIQAVTTIMEEWTSQNNSLIDRALACSVHHAVLRSMVIQETRLSFSHLGLTSFPASILEKMSYLESLDLSFNDLRGAFSIPANANRAIFIALQGNDHLTSVVHSERRHIQWPTHLERTHQPLAPPRYQIAINESAIDIFRQHLPRAEAEKYAQVTLESFNRELKISLQFWIARLSQDVNWTNAGREEKTQYAIDLFFILEAASKDEKFQEVLSAYYLHEIELGCADRAVCVFMQIWTDLHLSCINLQTGQDSSPDPRFSVEGACVQGILMAKIGQIYGKEREYVEFVLKGLLGVKTILSLKGIPLTCPIDQMLFVNCAKTLSQEQIGGWAREIEAIFAEEPSFRQNSLATYLSQSAFMQKSIREQFQGQFQQIAVDSFTKLEELEAKKNSMQGQEYLQAVKALTKQKESQENALFLEKTQEIALSLPLPYFSQTHSR